jgi:hypothetical protein
MTNRFLVFTTALLFVACKPPGESSNQVNVVVGSVYLTGNEPFTRLALLAEDGNRYLLKCEKDLEILLERSQGKKIAIRFSVIEYLPEGAVMTVLSTREVKK